MKKSLKAKDKIIDNLEKKIAEKDDQLNKEKSNSKEWQRKYEELRQKLEVELAGKKELEQQYDSARKELCRLKAEKTSNSTL